MGDLVESASATANASGRAEIVIGPLRAFETWHITGVAIQNTSTTNEPECRVYKGIASPSSLRGSSYSGRLDSGPADETLRNGDKLVAVWTGADAGSVSTITLAGTSERQ